MKNTKKINPILRYFYTLISMFRTNIRDYGMYIALFVIFIIFTIMTGGTFLRPINFTNLLNQTAYVAVLAVAMTLVIVTRQIDLSVGYLGAYLGAYVVVAVENNNEKVWWALVSALIITIAVGAIKGFAIAKIKVPSFVVTLAGMFIFKGLLMIKTDNRTISTSNEFFNKIGIGYLESIKIGRFDLIAMMFGATLISTLIIGSSLSRRKKQSLGIPNERLSIYLTKMAFMSGIIAFLTYNLAIYKGLSYLLIITIVVVIIYFFFTTQTVLGRRIYSVGGNPEAAELSGISVEKIIVFVFISMGILSLVSGVMYASRTQNTSPNHGPFWELYAIAAAYIGGTSANGGFGKIVNAVIGAIVIMSLKNGMALAGVDANIEPIVLGSVLLLAVVFDIYTRNVRGADLVGMHYAKRKYKTELANARIELVKVKQELDKAKKENKQNLLDYEYRYTNATAELAKIKELIRSAKEEDYIRA